MAVRIGMEFKGTPVMAQAEGVTPLFVAAFRGDAAMCVALLEHGASHAANRSGFTPLHIAAYKGHEATCKALLDHGATHTIITGGGSPLMLAVEQGHFEVSSLLLARGASHDACVDGATPLSKAARAGNLELCALLLDHGATHAPTTNGETPLYFAAELGHRALCELLMDRGAAYSRTRDGWSPLLAAASGGHGAVCTLLLDRGAPEYEGEEELSPLLMAALAGHSEACEALLDHGVRQRITRDGRVPLLEAAAKGHYETCAMLLARGAAQDARELCRAGHETLVVEAVTTLRSELDDPRCGRVIIQFCCNTFDSAEDLSKLLRTVLFRHRYDLADMLCVHNPRVGAYLAPLTLPSLCCVKALVVAVRMLAATAPVHRALKTAVALQWPLRSPLRGGEVNEVERVLEVLSLLLGWSCRLYASTYQTHRASAAERQALCRGLAVRRLWLGPRQGSRLVWWAWPKVLAYLYDLPADHLDAAHVFEGGELKE